MEKLFLLTVQPLSSIIFNKLKEAEAEEDEGIQLIKLK